MRMFDISRIIICLALHSWFKRVLKCPLVNIVRCCLEEADVLVELDIATIRANH